MFYETLYFTGNEMDSCFYEVLRRRCRLCKQSNDCLLLLVICTTRQFSPAESGKERMMVERRVTNGYSHTS